MKSSILITGANGVLAKNLSIFLEKDYSIRFLTRNPTKENEYQWNLNDKYIDPNAFEGVKHIIHLAGTPISSKRWTKNRKKEILSSRIDGANLILEELKKNKIVLESYISASAIGFYGTINSDKIFTEEDHKGDDFLSSVCDQWEKSADSFMSNSQANQVSIVRLGIIFSKNHGALKKLMKPIKYGLGSALGSGKQYIPWIHIDDVCGIIKHLLDNKISGTYNAVSPEHITNNELVKEIGSTLNRIIFLPNIPAFFIKVLFGEMSVILLKGSRVSSEKIINKGYDFKFKKVSEALNNILK